MNEETTLQEKLEKYDFSNKSTKSLKYNMDDLKILANVIKQQHISTKINIIVEVHKNGLMKHPLFVRLINSFVIFFKKYDYKLYYITFMVEAENKSPGIVEEHINEIIEHMLLGNDRCKGSIGGFNQQEFETLKSIVEHCTFYSNESMFINNIINISKKNKRK